MIMRLYDDIIEIFNPKRMSEITKQRDKQNKGDQKKIRKSELLESYRPSYYRENDDVYEEENKENFKKFLNRNKKLLEMFQIDKHTYNYEIPVWYAKILKDLLSVKKERNNKSKFIEVSKLYTKIQDENYSLIDKFFKKLLLFRTELLKDEDINHDEIDFFFDILYDPYFMCRMNEVRKIVNMTEIFIKVEEEHSSKNALLNDIIKNMKKGLLFALWEHFTRMQKEEGVEEMFSIHELFEFHLDCISEDHPEEYRILCDMLDEYQDVLNI